VGPGTGSRASQTRRAAPGPARRHEPDLGSEHLRAGLDGLTDAVIRAAPADVAYLVQVRLADLAALLPRRPDLRDGGHDLAGLTVAALRDVVLQPRLLHRMELLADSAGQTLDGRHLVRRAQVL